MSDHVRHLRAGAPETPELLAGYLARISRGELLTHREELGISRERVRQIQLGAEQLLQTGEYGRRLQEVVA
jgi:hypothetical protein